MSASLIDGKALAKKIRQGLAARIKAVAERRGRGPVLCVASRAKADRAAAAYRNSQKKACAEAGIGWTTVAADWTSAEQLLEALKKCDCDGVILDLPLDPAVDVDKLLAGLPPELDVEGATPYNFGRLLEAKTYAEVQRHGLIAPCTALAVAELIRSTNVPLAGKRAVVLGRSNIVGKPAAHLLSCLDLTVTLCHSKTRGLAELVGQADVVVAAMGKAALVKADWVKPGAVVVDAGINEAGGKLCGDVEPAAAERAAFLTPVPGGVGPVTTATLLANLVLLAERRNTR